MRLQYHYKQGNDSKFYYLLEVQCSVLPHEEAVTSIYRIYLEKSVFTKHYPPDWETESLVGATRLCWAILGRVNGDLFGLVIGLVLGKWGVLSPFPLPHLISTLCGVTGRGAWMWGVDGARGAAQLWVCWAPRAVPEKWEREVKSFLFLPSLTNPHLVLDYF